MAHLTISVAVASLVFFVLTLLIRGNGFGTEALTAAAFSTVIFAMAFAAIRVALLIFRGPKE